MEKHGIDAAWISSPENHLYLSGFANPDGRIFITAEKAYLFADFRYAENARRLCSGSFEVIEPKGAMIKYLPEIIAECGAVYVGYEEATLICSEFERLKNELSGCEFAHVSALLTELRRTKSEDEVKKMTAAQDIADAAFSHILGFINPSRTEAEVACELEYFMKKNGADGIAFETIAVSGKSSSSPHASPAQRLLEPGFLTMDYGATVEGYRSDMTRTVVLGHADEEMKRLYDTVLRAQEAGLKAVRAGDDCAMIDAAARDIIDGAGYKDAFGHSLGHGVGLEIHESPNLSPNASGKVLRVGDVVTVEPGIYLEGKYGCRIEDMVLVTVDGILNFAHSTKELIEIAD